MTNFTKMAAQGDLLIIKINNLPDGLEAAEPANGVHVVGHSETGHHHVIGSDAAQMLIDKTNEFIAYLNVNKEAMLEHKRDFDTHAPITLPPGNYEVRRQREYTPEGFRRAAD